MNLIQNNFHFFILSLFIVNFTLYIVHCTLNKNAPDGCVNARGL